MVEFFISIYVLICFGYVVGFLIGNDDIPDVVKFLIAIFSPIFAPILLGGALGMAIKRKLSK